MEHRVWEHTFSIEMYSKDSVSNVSLSNRSNEPVLIEGELGRIEGACFREDVTLEIIGSKGILRLDITREELEMLLCKKNASA